MLYLVKSFCHYGADIGRHGFTVDLHPDVPELVADSKLEQDGIDRAIEVNAREWLDRCGFDYLTKDSEHAPRLGVHVRCTWGKWGPEHITVPGNACGLDLSTSPGCLFPGGVSLLPHNVDSLAQKYMISVVFFYLMESVYLQSRRWERGYKRPGSDE